MGKPGVVLINIALFGLFMSFTIGWALVHPGALSTLWLIIIIPTGVSTLWFGFKALLTSTSRKLAGPAYDAMRDPQVRATINIPCAECGHHGFSHVPTSQNPDGVCDLCWPSPRRPAPAYADHKYRPIG